MPQRHTRFFLRELLNDITGRVEVRVSEEKKVFSHLELGFNPISMARVIFSRPQKEKYPLSRSELRDRDHRNFLGYIAIGGLSSHGYAFHPEWS
jgi:hypothetical protein